VGGEEPETIMRLWKDGFFDKEKIAEKVTFAPDDELENTLQDVYATLPSRVSAIRSKMDLKFLHVTKDEYIREQDIRGFCEAAGCEGDVIVDDMDHAIFTHGGIDAHDMPVYPTELLLELIEPSIGLIDISGLDKV
jgi:hypothetical protein